jgi:hypothetical protein
METVRGILWRKFFHYVYRLDKPCGDIRGNLCSKFFITYIGWRGHVEKVGEVSGVTFFVKFLCFISHVETLGKSLE